MLGQHRAQKKKLASWSASLRARKWHDTSINLLRNTLQEDWKTAKSRLVRWWNGTSTAEDAEQVLVSCKGELTAAKQLYAEGSQLAGVCTISFLSALSAYPLVSPLVFFLHLHCRAGVCNLSLSWKSPYITEKTKDQLLTHLLTPPLFLTHTHTLEVSWIIEYTLHTHSLLKLSYKHTYILYYVKKCVY